MTRFDKIKRVGVAALFVVLASLGAVAAASAPAGASPPTGTAPNYGHFDSDAISATYRDRSGNPMASVSGRIYWDSARYGHYRITVRDLSNNRKDAVIRIQSRTGDFDWITHVNYRIASVYTFDGVVSRGADIRELQFRVGQIGDYVQAMSVDSNRPGGA